MVAFAFKCRLNAFVLVISCKRSFDYLSDLCGLNLIIGLFDNYKTVFVYFRCYPDVRCLVCYES